MIEGNDFLRENPDVKNLVNINEKDNLVVWLFPRTGSKLFYTLMLNCDFKCYSYENNDRKLIRENLVHHHMYFMFPDIQKYKLIATVRNPYSLLVSHFYMFNGVEDLSKLKSSYKNFLESVLFSNQWYVDFLYGLNYVNVSYKIRVENLAFDYYNLPIITKSNHYKNKTMIDLINSKVNKSSNKLSLLDYRDFYDQSTADLVYYTFARYFEIFDYDKNSWKKN